MFPSAHRARRAAGAAAVLALAWHGSSPSPTAASAPPETGCVDALEASPALRRSGGIDLGLVMPEGPRILFLPSSTARCLAVVVTAEGGAQLALSLHDPEGIELVDRAEGTTAAILSCSSAAGPRYAVVRSSSPTVAEAKVFAADEEARFDMPEACRSLPPSAARGEVQVPSPPDGSRPRSASRGGGTGDAWSSTFSETEAHRVVSIGGRAVPLSFRAHAGRPLVVDAIDASTEVTIAVTTPEGERLGIDRVDRGSARVFVLSETDRPLVAWVRSASPVRVRIREAPP